MEKIIFFLLIHIINFLQKSKIDQILTSNLLILEVGNVLHFSFAEDQIKNKTQQRNIKNEATQTRQKGCNKEGKNEGQKETISNG